MNRTGTSLADHGTFSTSAGIESPKTATEGPPANLPPVVPPVPQPGTADPRELSTSQAPGQKEQFSIDELRVIAAVLGVPDRARLTESAELVAAIRERL